MAPFQADDNAKARTRAKAGGQEFEKTPDKDATVAPEHATEKDGGSNANPAVPSAGTVKDGPDDMSAPDRNEEQTREASQDEIRQEEAKDEKSKEIDQDLDHQGSFGKVKHKLTDTKQKVKDKMDPSGGFDETPLANIPSGYTVKIVFVRAKNLPNSDGIGGVSDPYIMATFSSDVPLRHKEDPPMVLRTHTQRRTLEPEWNQEWVIENVPASGFRLKCRLYDEDYPDHDDRLGNVTYATAHIDDKFSFGEEGRWFDVKKRMGSKRAYLLKAITSGIGRGSMTAHLQLKIDVIGRSKGKGSHMCTLGPGFYYKHFSPMIGRLTGIRVNKDEDGDSKEKNEKGDGKDDKHSKKYDFQANEIQLQGPVPEKLYHRFVEFRPIIGLLFTGHGLTGKILNAALHKQHRRVYNFDSSTEYGVIEPCTNEMSLQFLKLAHFDEGGRIFTYVLTLDGLLRFTETGKEFGIDLLSKHTMHSDVATYIACSGEFFIRRLAHADSSDDPHPKEPVHPDQPVENGPPNDTPPPDPKLYQLTIDNDSGTYRPDKSILPLLKEFLEKNFPGLGINTMDCRDDELAKLKDKQRNAKKTEGKTVQMVMNRSPSSSSLSSDDESRLAELETDRWEDKGHQHKSKKEEMFDIAGAEDRGLALREKISQGHKVQQGEEESSK